MPLDTWVRLGDASEMTYALGKEHVQHTTIGDTARNSGRLAGRRALQADRMSQATLALGTMF